MFRGTGLFFVGGVVWANQTIKQEKMVRPFIIAAVYLDGVHGLRESVRLVIVLCNNTLFRMMPHQDIFGDTQTSKKAEVEE